MAVANRTSRMTRAEFLAWEDAQPERHEFVDGEIFAMVGATLNHNTVAGNVYALLREQLRATSCRAYIETARVVTENSSFYPDVFVACEQSRKAKETREPVVIVEVLSPGTASYDRGRKWFAYQRIESLRHYVLVSQTEARVEVFTRATDGWRYTGTEGLDAEVALEAIGATLPLALIYEDADPSGEETEAETESEAHPS